MIGLSLGFTTRTTRGLPPKWDPPHVSRQRGKPSNRFNNEFDNFLAGVEIGFLASTWGLPPWPGLGRLLGSFLPPWCLPGASQTVQLILSCLPGGPNGSFLPPWCLPGASQAVQLILSCLPGASQTVQCVLSCLPGASQVVQMVLSCLPGASLSKGKQSVLGSRPWRPPQHLPRTGPFAIEVVLKVRQNLSLVPPWCLQVCPNGSFLPPWCLPGCPIDPCLLPWCFPSCQMVLSCLPGASLVPRKLSN